MSILVKSNNLSLLSPRRNDFSFTPRLVKKSLACLSENSPPASRMSSGADSQSPKNGRSNKTTLLNAIESGQILTSTFEKELAALVPSLSSDDVSLKELQNKIQEMTLLLSEEEAKLELLKKLEINQQQSHKAETNCSSGKSIPVCASPALCTSSSDLQSAAAAKGFTDHEIGLMLTRCQAKSAIPHSLPAFSKSAQQAPWMQQAFKTHPKSSKASSHQQNYKNVSAASPLNEALFNNKTDYVAAALRDFRNTSHPDSSPSLQASNHQHFQRPQTTDEATPRMTSHKSSKVSGTHGASSHSQKYSSEQTFLAKQTAAKLALRKQLERALLEIAPPKPAIANLPFIPSGSYISFAFLVGIEEIVKNLMFKSQQKKKKMEAKLEEEKTDAVEANGAVDSKAEHQKAMQEDGIDEIKEEVKQEETDSIVKAVSLVENSEEIPLQKVDVKSETDAKLILNNDKEGELNNSEESKVECSGIDDGEISDIIHSVRHAKAPIKCKNCATDFTPNWILAKNLVEEEEDGTKGTAVKTTNKAPLSYKILCENCLQTFQKKALKAEHSARLKSAFVKTLQREEENEKQMLLAASKINPAHEVKSPTHHQLSNARYNLPSSPSNKNVNSIHKAPFNKHTNIGSFQQNKKYSTLATAANYLPLIQASGGLNANQSSGGVNQQQNAWLAAAAHRAALLAAAAAAASPNNTTPFASPVGAMFPHQTFQNFLTAQYLAAAQQANKSTNSIPSMNPFMTAAAYGMSNSLPPSSKKRSHVTSTNTSSPSSLNDAGSRFQDHKRLLFDLIPNGANIPSESNKYTSTKNHI